MVETFLYLGAALIGVVVLTFAASLTTLGRRRKRSVRLGLRGSSGRAVTDIGPNGAICVDGDLWPAQASELIKLGERVEVTGYHEAALRVVRSERGDNPATTGKRIGRW